MSGGKGTHVVQYPMPEPIAAAATAWLQAGRPDGPRPRAASTVMLLRGSRPVEVFMLKRTSTMAFAASMWVFPGGSVDPRDAETDLPWAGPTPQQWAEPMGVPATLAAQLVIAAAREVFEESGVLLAGHDRGSVVGDVPAMRWRADRDALLGKQISFAQLLVRDGLVLRTDLLSLQDHWITPECEPRRYDTWFFAALLPPGQHADDDTTEAVTGGWTDPHRLLDRAGEDGAGLMPPTIAQLRRLAEGPGAEAIVRSMRNVVPVMPVPTPTEDGRLVMQVHLADE